MIVRSLKGLEDCVSLSHTGLDFVGKMGTDSYNGWSLPNDPTGNGFKTTFDVYNASGEYGRQQLSVPILFDKKTKRVVNNDSASIIVILNGAFDAFAKKQADLYPEALRDEIEAVNALIHPNICDGVYRAGFAKSEEAHEEARLKLFAALDEVEARLEGRDWLCGPGRGVLSLADVRAFPHLFRYDVCYHWNKLRSKGKTIQGDYPNIAKHIKSVYDLDGVPGTCDLHLSAKGYTLPAPKPLSPETADGIYEKYKFEYLPTIEQLLPNREKHGLPEGYLGSLLLAPNLAK